MIWIRWMTPKKIGCIAVLFILWLAAVMFNSSVLAGMFLVLAFPSSLVAGFALILSQLLATGPWGQGLRWIVVGLIYLAACALQVWLISSMLWPGARHPVSGQSERA